MEQRGVGENAVKVRGRQLEMQEILLPDVAASRVTRHCNEALGAIEADRAMAQCGEGLEISPRPAVEIQNRKRRLDFDMVQQRRDVLRDVVVARAVAEIFRVRVVLLVAGFSRQANLSASRYRPGFSADATG
jgi:hypothetical protein